MTSTDSVGRIAATCAFLLLIPSTIALGKLLDNFTLTSVLLVLFAEVSVSAAHEDFVVIDEELPDQYLLIGSGPLAVRPDRDVVVALGTAAVRSYETARAIGRK